MTTTENPTVISPKPNSNDATKNLFFSARVVGIVMPERFKVLYVIYSVILNLTMYIFVPISFILSYYVGWEHMKLHNFLTSLQFSVNAITCPVKFIFIIIYRKRYFRAISVIDRLDARVKYPEETSAVQELIIFCNRMVLIIICAYYTYSTVTFLVSVYRGRPPYGMYVPFLDSQDSLWSLVVVSTIEYLSTNTIIFQQMVNDVYAIIYVELMNCHLKLLSNRVLRIGTDARSTQTENLEELVQCIRDHKNILELVETLAPAVSGTYFLQFVATTVDLGITLISIAILSDKATLFATISYALCLIIELLPCCYFVDNLTVTARSLPNAIFHMNWMDQSLEFRRLCLFFMHRSQQDITFVAGKIFPISLESFVSIMKLSFSVYTLIDQMDFGKQFA